MKRGLPRPMRANHGGGGFFAILVMLLVAGAALGYFFYYVKEVDKRAAGANGPAPGTTARESEPVSAGPDPVAANNRPTPPPANNASSTPPAGNNAPDNVPEPPATPQYVDEAQAQEKLAEANAAYKSGDLDTAERAIRAFNELQDVTDETRDAGAQTRAKILVWQSFWRIQPPTTGGSGQVPVDVVFADAGAVRGAIANDDYERYTRWLKSSSRQSGNELIVSRLIGGYETIPYEDIGDIVVLRAEKLSGYWKRRLKDRRVRYEALPAPTALNRWQFARALKRAAPPTADESHPLIEEALDLVRSALEADVYFDQTLALEHDRDWPNYQRQSASKNSRVRVRAEGTLSRLLAKYPNAAQLRGLKDQEAADASQALVERARRGAEAAPEEKIDGKGEVDRALKSGDADEAFELGVGYARQARHYDSQALPGEPNAEANLERAIYFYLAAKKLYERALELGYDREKCEDAAVQANMGLFWCRKRKGI